MIHGDVLIFERYVDAKIAASLENNHMLSLKWIQINQYIPI